MQRIQNGKQTDPNLMDQENPEAIKEHFIRLVRILDTNDEKADLEQKVNKLIHLTKFQRLILLNCLEQYEDFFGGNLGERNRPPVDTPFKDKAERYRVQAFPIPVIHIETFKNGWTSHRRRTNKN